MKVNDPDSWADAVEFDHGIRSMEVGFRERARKKLAGMPFVHRQLLPLDQVDSAR